jgi:hypothetical protein
MVIIISGHANFQTTGIKEVRFLPELNHITISLSRHCLDKTIKTARKAVRVTIVEIELIVEKPIRGITS